MIIPIAKTRKFVFHFFIHITKVIFLNWDIAHRTAEESNGPLILHLRLVNI
jgi:hypothetical protein